MTSGDGTQGTGEPVTEPQTPGSPSEGPGPAGGSGGPQNGSQEAGSEREAALRRENAGYRHRAQDAEAERDRYRALLEPAQRAEVERLAARQLQHPQDLWTVSQLEAMRDPATGAIDEAKVNAEVDRVAAERPHWRVPVTSFDAGVRRSPPEAPSFGQALKEAARGGR